jgi:hypothetical protein
MISSELKDKVFQVINDELTVEQLEEWLAPRLPTFLASPNSADSDIVSAIELGLAEINDGIRTKDSLLRLLQSVIDGEEMILSFESHSSPSKFNVGESSNQTLQPTLDFMPMLVVQS